jgi:acyl carrier protein phosphodiesterase
LTIQQGIALHRAIDQFTDFHPITQEAKSYFKKDYRLYSGAFVDVVYDHFLANDKNEFANEKELDSFCQSTYINLQKNEAGLPEKFLQMLPYMKEQNWLFHYKRREGIEKSFGGLARRAVYLSESAIAFSIFNNHYQELENCYQLFFPELKIFSSQYVSQLNNQ